jgi:hypothetical protein
MRVELGLTNASISSLSIVWTADVLSMPQRHKWVVAQELMDARSTARSRHGMNLFTSGVLYRCRRSGMSGLSAFPRVGLKVRS